MNMPIVLLHLLINEVVDTIPSDTIMQEQALGLSFKDLFNNVNLVVTVIASIAGIVATIVGIIVSIRNLKKTQESNPQNKKIRFSMRTIKRSVNEIVTDIKNDKFVPSVIIGIGRGGGIFGSFISYKLYHKPLVVIDRDYDWKTGDRIDNILFDFDIPAYLLDKVLLVAGEVHTGETMKLFKKYLMNIGANDIRTCVFYQQSVCKTDINYYSKKDDGIPLMPWQDKKYIRDSISKEDSDELKKNQPPHKLEGKTIYIIRHGETENNKNDIFIGTTDVNLNANGIKRICELGEYLNKEECVTKNEVSIYSSPQKRAFDSAKILAKAINIEEEEIHKNWLLRERNYGVWENMERKEIQKKYPFEYEQYEKDPIHFTPPEADELLTIIHNIQKFLFDVSNDPKSKIIIVTHKTTGRLLISYFSKSTYSKYRDYHFENGCAQKCEIIDGKMNLIAI